MQGDIAENKKYLNDQPIVKNSPTDKSYISTGQKDFEKEKNKAIALLRQFHENGPEKCTKHPHSFF